MKKRKSRDGVAAERERERERKSKRERKSEVEEEVTSNVNEMASIILASEHHSEQQQQHWMMAAADEQMSWGTQWFPFWGVESYLSQLYLDTHTIWDDDDSYDDIWGFRNSFNHPATCSTAPSSLN